MLGAHERRGRLWISFLIVGALLAPVIVSLDPASAHDVGVPQLNIVDHPDHFKISRFDITKNDKRVHFLGRGESYTVKLTVEGVAPAGKTMQAPPTGGVEIPIVIWHVGKGDAKTNPTTDFADCVATTITSNDWKKELTFTVTIPSNAPNGANGQWQKFRVRPNAPAEVTSGTDDLKYRLPEGHFCYNKAPYVPPQHSPTPLEGRFAGYYVAIHRRPNLVVSENTYPAEGAPVRNFKWCPGKASSTVSCGQEVHQVANEQQALGNVPEYSGLPYNRTHYPRTTNGQADPDKEGPTHFRVSFTNKPPEEATDPRAWTATDSGRSPLIDPNCDAGRRWEGNADPVLADCANAGVNVKVSMYWSVAGSAVENLIGSKVVSSIPPANPHAIGDFSLLKRKGGYTFKAKLDVDNNITELDDDDNTGIFTTQAETTTTRIRSSDLVVQYRQGTSLDPDPLNHDSHVVVFDSAGHARLDIPIRIANQGHAKAWNESNLRETNGVYDSTRKIRYAVLIGGLTDDHEYRTPGVSRANIGKSLNALSHTDLTHTVHVTRVESENNVLVNPQDPNGPRWKYLPPGRHSLNVWIDPPRDADATGGVDDPAQADPTCTPSQAWTVCTHEGVVRESNNANNHAQYNFLTTNTAGPVFSTIKINNQTGPWTLHPGEKFFFQSFFNDSFDLVDVKVNLTYGGTGTNPTTPAFPLKLSPIRNETSDKYFARNFKAGEGVLKLGTHQVWVWVNDTARPNRGWESSKVNLRIEEWPIHAKDERRVITRPANHSTHAFDSNPVEIRVSANESETGWAPTHANAKPTIRLFKPDGTTEDKVANPAKYCALKANGNERKLASLDETCQATLEDTFIYFVAEHTKSPPGAWRAQAMIKDTANRVRHANVSYTISNSGPQIVTLEKDASVAAGQLANVKVRAKDESGILNVYANFTRTGGFYCNATLSRTWPSGTGTVAEGWWNGTIPTGKASAPSGLTMSCTGGHATVPHAGAHTVRVAVKDTSNTWTTQEYAFTVEDTAAPTIASAGALPATIAIDTPATFYAVATDDTLITTATAVITGPSGFSRTLQLAGNQLANGALQGNVNFTASTTLTTDGSYSAEFRIADANNNQRTRTVSFTVVRDAGPVFEVVEPRTKADSVTWLGSGAPRIALQAIDRDGVSQATFKATLKVAGRADEILTCTSTHVTCDATTSPKGLRVTYTRPSSQGWQHGLLVTVELEADDLGSPARRSAQGAHFKLLVDAKAPTSQEPVPEPAHRDAGSHLWNVSPASLFRFRGTDNSDAPTSGVTVYHYKLNGVEGRLSADSPTLELSASLRTGEHTLEYWAEDGAGNSEATPRKVMRFYLDAEVPIPDTAFGQPSGRYVNATFFDRSGVATVTIRHRVNDGPYTSLAARKTDDQVWRAVVPGGQKGDRLCYYLLAEDRLGNLLSWGDAQNPLSCFPVENNAPRVTLDAPADGATVSGKSTIRWSVTDSDGDKVTVTLALRAAGRQSFTDLRQISDGSTSYAWDTAKFQDGQYDLKITATDGFFFPSQVVTVKIANGGDLVKILPIDAETPEVGDDVLLQAKVGVQATKVEADVYLDGEYWDTVTMRDDGKTPDEEAGDGVYSAYYAPDEAGDYSVRVRVEYRDGGELKSYETEDASLEFSVLGSGAGVVFREFAGLWVTIGLLAAACVGVAVFALTRRGS